MNGRQNDQLFQFSLIVLLCSYIVLGNNSFYMGWVPSFDLFAFGKPQKEVSRYTLKFHSINGESFMDPLYFEDAGDWLDNGNIAEGKRIVNRLGIALDQADEQSAVEQHQILIDEYLDFFESVDYEIILLVVNPVEKYSTESYVAEQSVRFFSHSGNEVSNGTVSLQ